MIKQADLNQVLGSLGNSVNDAGSSLRTWYSKLDPTLRNTLLRGLAGAAVGGVATGGIAAMTPRDEDDRKSVLGPALLGALLGGGTAAALPIGAKLLGSGIRFKNESRRPAGAKTVEALGAPIVTNPLTVGLPAYTAYRQRHAISTLLNAMTNPKVVKDVGAPALRRMTAALNNPAVWKNVSRNRLALIPLALAGGYFGDQYLKGRY